jgi:archaellum biogenesis protein FlaJ (TadC family)
MLNGIATNIVSGGSLKNFLEKRSEDLLNDYRLEREKYNSIAATFMDVYISILITAPLILIMLVVVIGLTGMDLGGMSVGSLVLMSISAVILLNTFFLIFLQIRQPTV